MGIKGMFNYLQKHEIEGGVRTLNLDEINSENENYKR